MPYSIWGPTAGTSKDLRDTQRLSLASGRVTNLSEETRWKEQWMPNVLYKRNKHCIYHNLDSKNKSIDLGTRVSQGRVG